MKKLLTLFIMFPIISLSGLKCDIGNIKNNIYSEGLSYLKIGNPEIYRSYLLVNDKGDILIEDNSNEILPLASITKIMTAMVVLDNVKDLDRVITVNKKESKIPYGVRLKNKSQYTVYELLHFMLIRSSNSSAQVLADNVSDDFINLMNKKAKKIGAVGARYCTPHGLPPKYTNTCLDIASASDVYKISKYAVENYPLIAKITSTKYKVIANKKLKNTNDLLGKYQGILGIKTGFHNQARYNISILYDNNGTRLYEVILGSDSSDNRSLISTTVFDKFGGN